MDEKHKYVLLRGQLHQNVFWTTRVKSDAEYLEEGYDVLFTSNDTDEMVREWDKYNPNPIMSNILSIMQNFNEEV